ncbi:hypothetical protein J6Z39_03150 [bacterium]|nr:hypothetical protein [bacterium]
MSNKTKTTLIALITAVIQILPFYYVRKHLIENERPKVETIDSYPEPDFAKIMYLGMNAFAADLLFARAQYYYGSHYITDKQYKLLAQMIRVIMALNPKLLYAIPFAETAIASMGTYDSVEEANSLLQLGHELEPNSYYYIFDQGFNYFLYLNDMEKAYPYMYRSLSFPDTPKGLLWLVNHVATMGGGYRLGYEHTKAKLETTKDPNMREQLEKDLENFANLYNLTLAADEYYKKFNKSPDKELNELVSSGLIKEIPADIFGGAYYYDSDSRLVKSTSEGDRRYKEKQEAKKQKEAEKKEETQKTDSKN